MKTKVSVYAVLLALAAALLLSACSDGASSDSPSAEDESSAEVVGGDSFEETTHGVTDDDSEDESYVYSEKPQSGVIGGYYDDGWGNPHYMFSFSGKTELWYWLLGKSDLYLKDENDNEVKLHDHAEMERLREWLKERTVYAPTMDGVMQQIGEVTVYFNDASDVKISYNVYTDDGSSYGIDLEYGEDATDPMFDGGIVNYFTQYYYKTGRKPFSQTQVYSLAQLPIYVHKDFRFADTEVLVIERPLSDGSRYASTEFILDRILVLVSGNPKGRNGAFDPDNYKGLGFIDMFFVEPVI